MAENVKIMEILNSMLHIYMFCYNRAVGGVQAEREERDRWITKERKRIQDSVDGMY